MCVLRSCLCSPARKTQLYGNQHPLPGSAAAGEGTVAAPPANEEEEEEEAAAPALVPASEAAVVHITNTTAFQRSMPLYPAVV